MSIFLFSLLAVFSISYLLVQIIQRDPFADENARSLLFPGFRAQRSLAKTSFMAICMAILSIGIAAALIASTMTTLLAASASVYFVTGSIFVLREVNNLTYDRRSSDPVLHGIALAASWPIWKTQYRLYTRID